MSKEFIVSLAISNYAHQGNILVSYFSIILCSLLLACESSSQSTANEIDMLVVNSDSDLTGMVQDTGVIPEDRLEDMQPTPLQAHGKILAGVATRGHANGSAENTRFDGVTCIAQSQRWLWMSDTFNGTLRRTDIETGETVTVGGQPYELAVVDGSPEVARFESPRGCALTEATHPLGAAFWVADGPALRKVSLSDDLSEALDVTTILGRAGERGNIDGIGSEARLGYLTHHILPSPDLPILYLADRSNDSLREVLIDESGEASINTLVQGLNGPGGLAWSSEGLLIANTFDGELVLYKSIEENLELIVDGLGAPQGVCTHEDKAWVAGFEGVITEIDLRTGRTSILAGVEDETSSVDGTQSKARLGGSFASPICDPANERLLYMDINSGSLRKVSLDNGYVGTMVGASNPSIRRDGRNEDARFNLITDVVGVLTSDARPNELPTAKWFVADPGHKAVRIIDETEGLTSTLFSGVTRHSLILDGPLDEATAETPIGLAYDSQTNSLYVSDAGAHIIRRVDLNLGEVLTIAGQVNEPGSQDGLLDESSFNEPLGLSLDEQGYLYVVDGNNGTIRSVKLSTGEVKTLSEPLPGLFDVEIGEDGWLYATNEVDATLVRLTPRLSDLRGRNEVGRWETIAGEVGVTGPADGQRGLLAYPLGLTKGPNGTLLVSDADNHRIRSYSLSNGHLDTFVGSLSNRGSITGTEQVDWSDLTLYSPYASAWLGSGRGAVVYEGVLMGLWNPSDLPPVEVPPTPPPMLSDLPLGDFEVELRSGEHGESILQPNEVITLHRGCQGAQHAWIGLKITDINVEPSSLKLMLIDAENELASLYLEGEYWSEVDPSGFELLGLTFVIYNPAELLDRELVIGAEVTLPSGETGYGWSPVIVTWGEDACGKH